MDSLSFTEIIIGVSTILIAVPSAFAFAVGYRVGRDRARRGL